MTLPSGWYVSQEECTHEECMYDQEWNVCQLHLVQTQQKFYLAGHNICLF